MEVELNDFKSALDFFRNIDNNKIEDLEVTSNGDKLDLTPMFGLNTIKNTKILKMLLITHNTSIPR
jgi:hypothetical protein